jgi:WD40 repeat protein
MLELRYKLQNQSSSTVLCFSNYNESQILIAIVDLKTRRKNIIKTFKNQRRPTFIHQIDESNLLVGTEGGLIEHWSIDSDTLISTFEAHTSSDEGVSSIIEIQSSNYLLWGEQEQTEGSSLIATASLGCPDFRLWLMQLTDQLSLTPHMRIETSFGPPGTGIRYLLEATETQLVAVDTHRTLKFYEFIDKRIKEENERIAKEEEEIIKGLKELFEKYDADQNGLLTFDEFQVMAQDFFQTFGVDKEIGKPSQWTKEH